MYNTDRSNQLINTALIVTFLRPSNHFMHPFQQSISLHYNHRPAI